MEKEPDWDMPKKLHPKVEANEDSKDQVDEILNSSAFKEARGVYGARDLEKIKYPEIIPTSSVGLDIFLDGGFRAGWSKWQGDYESGKTSMALCWGRNWQNYFKENGRVIYIDAEGKLDSSRVFNSGIDVSSKKLKIVDIHNADKAFDFITSLILNNPDEKRYFFVLDSVNAIRRTEDMDKIYSDSEKVGAAGLLLSAAGSKLSLPISKFGHHLFIIQQLRANINTRTPGAKTTSDGPNAPKFYSNLMGEIQKLWTDLYIFDNPSDAKSKRIGHLQRIKFTKTFNQKSGQFVEIPIKYGLKGGIWPAYEAFGLGREWGLIQQKTGWFTITDPYMEELLENKIEFPQKTQGEKQFRVELESHPDFVEYTLSKIKKAAV